MPTKSEAEQWIRGSSLPLHFKVTKSLKISRTQTPSLHQHMTAKTVLVDTSLGHCGITTFGPMSCPHPRWVFLRVFALPLERHQGFFCVGFLPHANNGIGNEDQENHQPQSQWLPDGTHAFHGTSTHTHYIYIYTYIYICQSMQYIKYSPPSPTLLHELN